MKDEYPTPMQAVQYVKDTMRLAGMDLNARQIRELEQLADGEISTEDYIQMLIERHTPTHRLEDYADYAIVDNGDDTPLVYSLGRLISDTTQSHEIGYFAGEDGMRRALDAHIMEQSMAIATMFSGRSKNLDTNSDTKVRHPDVDLEGYVIRKEPKTGAIRELKADSTHLVMRHTPFDANRVDMRIVTFMPTVDDASKALETGRDLRDALLKTTEYRNATALERVFLERCCDPEAPRPEVEVRYVPYEDMIVVSLPSSKAVLACRTQGHRMIIEAIGTKHGTILIHPNPDETGKDLIKTLNEHYPGQMHAIADIKDRFDIPYDRLR